jgi:hypothetical protein
MKTEKISFISLSRNSLYLVVTLSPSFHDLSADRAQRDSRMVRKVEREFSLYYISLGPFISLSSAAAVISAAEERKGNTS